MKVTLISIGLLVTSTLLASCHHSDDASHHHDAESHSAHPSPATAEDALDGMQLNDGQKWQMDDHTRSVFAKMAASFSSSDHLAEEGEGLKKAGTALRADIDDLIAGCTMTGEAHDQLHKYLTGYIPAVTALAESGGVEQAEKVGHYLDRYDEFFE